MTGKSLQVVRGDIEAKIHTLRGMQIMLDTDLATLFGVETKRLNEQVKRNSERFPAEFCFQLTHQEMEILRSHFATSSWGGRRNLPYAFTEQGVAMLSTVLKSKTAVQMSIKIMKAFVAMRHFIASHAQVFKRLDSLELKQIETEAKVEKVLDALGNKDIQPKQGIFFEGEVFDAYRFVADLVRSAKRSITLIDNYVDDTVLTLFSKRKKGVALRILTKAISKELSLDIKKHHAQFPPLSAEVFPYAHDRFLILDEKEVYHFGASLKDLGRKWFAFSRLDGELAKILIERAR